MMNNIIYGFLALFLIVGIGSAWAGSSVTSCADPTTRADGTPFDAATDLDKYEWYVDDVYIQDTTSCAPFTLVAPGPDGDKRVQALTVDTDGRRSVLSPEAIKPFTTSAPNPPAVN